MASVTLSQLLTPVTRDDARKTVIAFLQSLGFRNAAAWQSGTLPRTMCVEVPALVLSDLSAQVAKLAAGGFSELAQGDWLTLYSLNAYDNERQEAVRAKGACVLTVASTGLTSYALKAGYVVAVATNGQTFRNIEAATLVKGTPLTLDFEADEPGSAGNVAPNTVVALQTPLAGVAINNPPTASGHWLTRFGADEESDAELRQRNRTKWATRSYAAPSDAYKNWALETDAVITRSQVLEGDASEPGAVKIYIAGVDGELPSEVAGRVERYIEGTLEVEYGGDGIVRRPLGALVHCYSADALTVTVAGTVYYAPEYAATVQQGISTALKALFDAWPIGGVAWGDVQGFVFARLYAAVMSVPGVVNVAFTTPLANIAMTTTQVAVLVDNLVYTVAT